MPFYEYSCEACGHDFEKLMKMGASAPPCPECASDNVRKKISAPNFHLKGGGWYKDGYGSKKVPQGGWETGGGSEGSPTPAPERHKKPGDKKPDAAKSSDGGSSSTGAKGD